MLVLLEIVESIIDVYHGNFPEYTMKLNTAQILPSTSMICTAFWKSTLSKDVRMLSFVTIERVDGSEASNESNNSSIVSHQEEEPDKDNEMVF